MRLWPRRPQCPWNASSPFWVQILRAQISTPFPLSVRPSTALNWHWNAALELSAATLSGGTATRSPAHQTQVIPTKQCPTSNLHYCALGPSLLVALHQQTTFHSPLSKLRPSSAWAAELFPHATSSQSPCTRQDTGARGQSSLTRGPLLLQSWNGRDERWEPDLERFS